jgi:hypothetical protein
MHTRIRRKLNRQKEGPSLARWPHVARVGRGMDSRYHARTPRSLWKGPEALSARPRGKGERASQGAVPGLGGLASRIAPDESQRAVINELPQELC